MSRTQLASPLRVVATCIAAFVPCIGCGTTVPAGPAPLAPAQPLALRTAVQQANQGGTSATWSIEGVFKHAGFSIEHYRLGGGPSLLLMPDQSTQATTVQVWLPFGWGDESPGRAGEAMRWAAGWANRVGSATGPALEWHGSARDVSGAVWTVGASTTPKLLHGVMGQWPTATSTPTASISQTLRRRMRRAFWDVVRGPAPAGWALNPHLQADRAVWIVAGRFDRGQVLSTARKALAVPVAAPAKPNPRRSPGLGPRIPLEVPAPKGLRPTALIAWSWSHPTPERMAEIRGLAQLLGGGSGSRLEAMARDSVLEGASVNVATGRDGASLEAYLHLGTVSATVAAARLKDVLRDIGSGRTTGLEFETLQYRLQATHLETWAHLERRAQKTAEALLFFDDLSRLAADHAAREELAEPAIRALAQSMVAAHPVVVVARAQ